MLPESWPFNVVDAGYIPLSDGRSVDCPVLGAALVSSKLFCVEVSGLGVREIDDDGCGPEEVVSCSRSVEESEAYLGLTVLESSVLPNVCRPAPETEDRVSEDSEVRLGVSGDTLYDELGVNQGTLYRVACAVVCETKERAFEEDRPRLDIAGGGLFDESGEDRASLYRMFACDVAVGRPGVRVILGDSRLANVVRIPDSKVMTERASEYR